MKILMKKDIIKSQVQFGMKKDMTEMVMITQDMTEMVMMKKVMIKMDMIQKAIIEMDVIKMDIHMKTIIQILNQKIVDVMILYLIEVKQIKRNMKDVTKHI